MLINALVVVYLVRIFMRIDDEKVLLEAVNLLICIFDEGNLNA